MNKTLFPSLVLLLFVAAAYARPCHIDSNPNLRDCDCAPQVSCFPLQKKWHLIYQSQPSQFSTADDQSNHETWTRPESFFVTKPPGPARYYRGWIANRLDGKWTPISDAISYQKPFAGIDNVTFEGGVAARTKDVGHGNLIRGGYDEALSIGSNNLHLLYQDRDPSINPRYDQRPCRLGLLKLDRTINLGFALSK